LGSLVDVLGEYQMAALLPLNRGRELNTVPVKTRGERTSRPAVIKISSQKKELKQIYISSQSGPNRKKDLKQTGGLNKRTHS